MEFAQTIARLSLASLLLWPLPSPGGEKPEPGHKKTTVLAEPKPTCTGRYDVETKFLSNPDESVLIAGVIGWCRQSGRPLLWDERYAAVARQWSATLIEGQVSPEQMLPVDRLKFDLRQAGVTDAAVVPFTVEGPPEKMPAEMIEFLTSETAKARYTHFAVGVTRRKDQQSMLSTLLIGRRPALIEPLPVCPKPASRLRLRMRLLRDYSHPTWLMTLPDGTVARDTLLYEEGIWRGKVPLDAGQGIYQMEIVLQGPTGPEVAALFPLYVGVERPRMPTIKVRPAPERYRTPEEAEAAMVKLINQERATLSLPPLTVEPGLATIAREYALEVLNGRHAVHRTETSGALPDRLRKADIPFARGLENVSLTASPELAHERFMESPGHRINVVDPSVTLLGVGIAMERGAQEDILAVCEVFVEPIESGDITELTQRLFSQINGWRRSRGRFALGLDQELSREALRSARRLAAAGQKADAQQEGDALIASLSAGLDVRDVQVRYFKTTTFKQVLTARQLLDENFNRLGIGLAKSTGRQSQPDEYWIALLFAGR